MATLLIATPFVHNCNALRNRVLIGFHGEKTLRLPCRQGAGAVSASAEDAVVQSSSSPLQNIPPECWIAAFSANENVHGDAHCEAVVAAPTLIPQLEPASEYKTSTSELLRQGERRRSGQRVIFTDEKARRLRKENRATQTFHDKRYHSAIASKLAMPE